MPRRKKAGRPRKGAPRAPHLLPKPAPGRLKLLQDAVNSYDNESRRDEWATPEALGLWLVEHKLASSGTTLDEAEWRRAREVREALRAVLHSHAGVALSEKALERFNRELQDAQPVARLGSDGLMSLVHPDGGWAGAFTQLADAILQAIRGDTWKRLKACRNPECQRAFYDSTTNLIGKWCNARRCGNRANVKKYRRRGPSYNRPGWVAPEIDAEMTALAKRRGVDV